MQVVVFKRLYNFLKRSYESILSRNKSIIVSNYYICNMRSKSRRHYVRHLMRVDTKGGVGADSA